MGVTSLGRHTRPACNQALLAMCWLKKWLLTTVECVFLDFWDARGLGLLFVVCACAVGLRGNGLTGMRGTWGVVWRSAHVPTIPFTWLRRAKALGPTAHASYHHATRGLPMNAYVLYPMRSREQIDNVPYANQSRDPLKQYFLLSLLRSDWLRPEVALYSTTEYASENILPWFPI